MKFKIRIDKKTESNTTFAVFMDGAICGKLCMKDGEAEEFIAVILSGCAANGDHLLVTEGT